MEERLCVNGCGRLAEPARHPGPAPRYCSDECRHERKAEKFAKWRARNPDYNAEYYAANRPRERGRTARRYAQNKQVISDYYAKRRASASYKEQRRQFLQTPAGKAQLCRQNHERKARAQGAYSEWIDRNAVFERDRGVCGICGRPVDPADWHLDHIVPLGPGDHVYANVRISHPACNRRKVTEDKQALRLWREAA